MAQNDDKRCFTIMIVPHSEEATYSLRLPLYIVQVAVAFLVLVVTGFCVLGYAYLRAASGAQEAQALRELNRAQQEEIDALAIETERMMEQIYAIDELVEMVTERLDLDPEVLNQDLYNSQLYNPSNHYPHTVNSADNVNAQDIGESVRLYSSRSSGGGVLDRAVDNIELLQSLVPEKTVTLDTVGDYVAKAEAKPSIWPARGRLASGFGVRRIPYASGYQFHMGVDIIGAHGSSIWATASGEVVFVGYRGSYGNMVIIDHGYDYETLYAHLTDYIVTVGEQVEKGQLIGHMGASGRTTGTHLHYEVHHKGTPVNPVNFMKKQ